MSYGGSGSTNPYASSTAPQFKPPGAPTGPGGPQRKSGWAGMTAIACGVIAGLIEIVATVVATMAVMAAGGGEPNPESPELMIAGCGIFVGIGIALIGIVFGIVGLAVPNSNKVTAGIGAGISALVIVCICGLMTLGIAAG